MPPYREDPSLLEAAFLMIEPYLPATISRPLHHLVTLPFSDILSNPTSLIPILLSLFAVYTAMMSMYNTTRMAVRLAWFVAKWSTLLGAVAVAYNGYQNGWKETGHGLRKVGDVGQTALGFGRSGVQWWLRSDSGTSWSSSARGNSRRGKTRPATLKKNDKRSASGKPRTWARRNDDGDWDDPAEVDLGNSEHGGGDAWKSAQEALLSFMGSSSNGGSDRSTKPAAAAAKKKATNPAKQTKAKSRASGDGDDVGGWAMKYAMTQAKKLWDDATGSASGKNDRPKRNR